MQHQRRLGESNRRCIQRLVQVGKVVRFDALGVESGDSRSDRCPYREEPLGKHRGLRPLGAALGDVVAKVG